MDSKIIKFYSDYCTPCKVLDKKLKELNLNGIRVVSVNVEEFSEIAEKHNVQSVPTMIFVRNNVSIGRLIGTQKNETIQKYVDLLR